jgi:IS1 family transposase
MSTHPRRRRVAGKAHTAAVERDNSNTRHRHAKFTRRTKVVSRSRHAVDPALRIWHAIATTDLFHGLREIALSIY